MDAGPGEFEVGDLDVGVVKDCSIRRATLMALSRRVI